MALAESATPTRIRVAFDAWPLVKPRAGTGQYAYQLIGELARLEPSNEYVAFYLAPFWADRRHAELTFPGADVTIAGQGWLRTNLARVQRRLGRERSVEDFIGPVDLFHATNNIFPCAVRAARSVVTIHDATLLLFPEWHPQNRLDHMVPRLTIAAARADRIITPSQSAKSDVVKHLGIQPERVTVVPEAADPAFRVQPRHDVEPSLARLGLAYGQYLLFLGAIEPRKNLERLLTALESVAGRVGPLVVAGPDGWKNADVQKRLATLERRGLVRHLGYIESAARPALMAGARALVYPSLYEGFGLPPLEAMACGTPVLTSDVASLPEVVGDAAMLVDPRDVRALASAMERLWNDSALCDELRARGLARAARFSWRETARQTLAVYRELVGA